MYNYLTPVNLFYSLNERRWGRGWVLTNRYKSITSTSSQEEGHLTPLFPSKTYDIQQLWVNAQVLKKKYALIQIKYSDIEKKNFSQRDTLKHVWKNPPQILSKFKNDVLFHIPLFVDFSLIGCYTFWR